MNHATLGVMVPSYPRHVLRRLPLSTLGAAALLAGGCVLAWAPRQQDATNLVVYLRLPAIILAASAAPFLDDVAAPLLDVTPRGRIRRRGLDALVALTLVLAAWTATTLVTLALLDRGDTQRVQFPWGASLIEVTALTLLGFVAMIIVTQITGSGHGARVAMVIGVLALGSFAIPQTNAWLWPAVPFGRAWRDAHVRWTVLAIIALGTLTLLSRDPAKQTRHRSAQRNSRQRPRRWDGLFPTRSRRTRTTNGTRK